MRGPEDVSERWLVGDVDLDDSDVVSKYLDASALRCWSLIKLLVSG